MSSPSKIAEKKGMKKGPVDHSYRDYSRVEISELVKNYKGVKKGQFPAKLHRILSKPEYANIVAWKSHGRAWAVVDKKLFTSIVLPKYFDHNNFDSFNRSVNGWGFKRLVGEGPDQNAYYHELFLYGRTELTRAMTRLVNPGKRLPNKSEEPDFYEMSKKHPLPRTPSTPKSSPVRKSQEAKGGRRGNGQPPTPTFAPQASWSHLPQAQGNQDSLGYHQGVLMSNSQPPPHMQHAPYVELPPGYIPSPYAYGPYHRPPPGHYYQPHHAAMQPNDHPTNSFRPDPWVPTSSHPPHGSHPQSVHDQYYHQAAETASEQPADNPLEDLRKTLPVLHTHRRGGAKGIGQTDVAGKGDQLATGQKPAAQYGMGLAQAQPFHEVINPPLNDLPSQFLEGMGPSPALSQNDEMSLDESLSDLFQSSEGSSLSDVYQALEVDAQGDDAAQHYSSNSSLDMDTSLEIDNLCQSIQPIPMTETSQWHPLREKYEGGG